MEKKIYIIPKTRSILYEVDNIFLAASPIVTKNPPIFTKDDDWNDGNPDEDAAGW